MREKQIVFLANRLILVLNVKCFRSILMFFTLHMGLQDLV